jgi:TonB family protein
VTALLVEAAARSLALGLIATLALALLRVRSAHMQKTVWTTVLLASLVMPLLLYTPIGPTIPMPSILVGLRAPQVLEAPSTVRWLSVASILYCAVAAALTARYAAVLARMWVIRRAARRLTETWSSGLDVRVTERIGVPATFGSCVLLPAGFEAWSDRKRDAVVAHERSHVVEKDCYLLWLARLYACLFWFNPMAWWIQRKISALAEVTSDDAAVGIVGDRPAYAEILLEFATCGRAVHNGLVPIARSRVSHRIDRIITQTAFSRRPSMKRRLIAIAAVLPAIVFVALPLEGLTAGIARAEPANTGSPQAGQSPRVTNYGGLADLMKYYPPEARDRGIEGFVDLAVTLDTQGRATDTMILSEDPLNMGFGAAASTLAHTMEYSNPTGHPVQLTFRVKFALDKTPHAAAP